MPLPRAVSPREISPTESSAYQVPARWYADCLYSADFPHQRARSNLPTPYTIADVIDEITRYLDAHPHAADTVDGIARWWLSGPGVDCVAREDLQQALEQLVARGTMTRVHTANGTVLYASASHQSRP
jgi:hypothetical protein